MSMITDIEATVARSVAYRKNPVAIKMSERSLVHLADALRRHDEERRNFNIKAIGGAPYVWSPRVQDYVPIRPRSWRYQDSKGFRLDIPFVVSDVMPDDQFVVEFGDSPLLPVATRDKEAWKHENQPSDTGIIQ